MSFTQSPSPIAALIDRGAIEGLFADTAPGADLPPSYSPILDDVEAAVARKLREDPKKMRDALTEVFKNGDVDKMFTDKLEKLAATVTKLQHDFDTVSVALVRFDGEKYIDPATQQPIKEYRPEWMALSTKYTELLTTSRKFAGTIQFRATKYRTHILPALVNAKLSQADKLKTIDWFLKDTPKDRKTGGAYEDIEKDAETPKLLKKEFTVLALAVREFQNGITQQFEKVGIALDDNIVILTKKVAAIRAVLDEYTKKGKGLVAGAGVSAALFGGGLALALCTAGILAPIGIILAVFGALVALGLAAGASAHFKFILDLKASLATAELDLSTAQRKKAKYDEVIRPVLEAATDAMGNIGEELGAIADIFAHITNDAHQARMALQDSLDDDTPDHLKEGVHELTTQCLAKLGLGLEAFAVGCDKGLGSLV